MVMMKTTEDTLIPPELMAELQAAADNAAKGVRDPEATRQACERMDRMREQNRKLFGEQNIGWTSFVRCATSDEICRRLLYGVQVGCRGTRHAESGAFAR